MRVHESRHDPWLPPGPPTHTTLHAPSLPPRCCRSQTLIIANAVIIYLVLERTPSFLREFRRRASEGILKREGWDTLAAWGLTAALGAALYPLYSSRMIPEENGKVYSGGSCWADLPIHMVRVVVMVAAVAVVGRSCSKNNRPCAAGAVCGKARCLGSAHPSLPCHCL